MKKQLFILFIIFIISSWILFFIFKKDKISKTNNNQTFEQAVEVTKARFFATRNKEYKTTGNARFHFWFDLPVSWDAEDRSANGDGYFIIPGNKDIDIRIYGTNKALSDEEYYNSFLETGGKIADFQFTDGSKGKTIENGNQKYFIKSEDDYWITLYVNGPEKWYQENKEHIIYIANSIRLVGNRKIYTNE